MPYSDHQTELEEFCGYFREMVEEKSSDEALIQYVFAAMRGHANGPQLRMIAEHIAYLEEKQRYEGAITELEAKVAEYDNYEAELDEEYEARKAELEEQYEAYELELEEQYESRIMYDLAEEKFISNEGFREQILERMRSDIRRSREKNEPPELFELTLKHCEEDRIVKFLVSEYKEELFQRYMEEIILILSEEINPEIREEIRNKLLNDPEFNRDIRRDLMKDLAAKLFD